MSDDERICRDNARHRELLATQAETVRQNRMLAPSEWRDGRDILAEARAARPELCLA